MKCIRGQPKVAVEAPSRSTPGRAHRGKGKRGGGNVRSRAIEANARSTLQRGRGQRMVDCEALEARSRSTAGRAHRGKGKEEGGNVRSRAVRDEWVGRNGGDDKGKARATTCERDAKRDGAEEVGAQYARPHACCAEVKERRKEARWRRSRAVESDEGGCRS